MTTLIPEATDRDPLDFNRTPAWCVELLIPELGQPATILDAGCGDGALGWPLRGCFPDAIIDGVELDLERHTKAVDAAIYDYVWCRSWLDETPLITFARNIQALEYDLIISNPPFGLPALDFLRCALARVRPGGTVAFLLPTHWDHDPDVKTEYARQRFLDSIMYNGHEGYCKLAIVGGGPNPCRPSFRGGPNTATDRYAWFMFGDAWAGQPSRRLHAIPPAVETRQVSLL